MQQNDAGLILYLLDVTFRIAQQAYPVRLRVASVHDNSQLATLQFDMDPLTPQDPIQASLLMSQPHLTPEDLTWSDDALSPRRCPCAPTKHLL